jgi:uncharacterized protein YdeI (YjbR/CyaY-like superfamily)
MSKINPSIESFFINAPKWADEMEKLRMFILDCGLNEEVKWGKPCYMYKDHNIVIIQGFKEYCALLFFKGALLSNSSGILQKTGPNTQVGRQIRFTDFREIIDSEKIIKECVHEAIEVEKAGLNVRVQNVSDFSIPEEFQSKLEKNPTLKKSFYALTPGKQKAYLIYFSSAKQPATRVARIEKYIPMILEGKAFNER